MEYGICNISVIPCRKEPQDQAEMVSQVLFGEVFKVLERRKKWSQIRTAIDNYESWVDNKQYALIEKETYDRIVKTEQHYANDLVWSAKNNSGETHSILLGSTLPDLSDQTFKLGNADWIFDGEVAKSKKSAVKSDVVLSAFRLLNAPYLWGGRTPFGIDCSGFTQLVYKLNHKNIPRDAWQQAELGESLSFIEEAEPGDLAFFDNEEGRIVHVGIVLENNNIIHASGKVRIDRLDHQGIHNREARSYSHKLRIIKKIL